MAVLPSFKKLLQERFPEQGAWILGLITPINAFFDDVVNALNKRLTFRENFNGERKSITVDGTYPLKLAWGRSSKPTIGWIGAVARQDGSTVAITTACQVLWSFNQEGQISISDIVGLDDSATKKYKLEIVFLVD